jgi:hypothetical protein
MGGTMVPADRAGGVRGLVPGDGRPDGQAEDLLKGSDLLDSGDGTSGDPGGDGRTGHVKFGGEFGLAHALATELPAQPGAERFQLLTGITVVLRHPWTFRARRAHLTPKASVKQRLTPSGEPLSMRWPSP